jgi:DNA-binding winged helix-turn-helix (wHTH) protein/TolB-like protein/Tfp pilus assembly protein PilF
MGHLTEGSGAPRAQRVRFGPFELDLRAGELRKHNAKIRLQEQPFLILVMLLDQPGEVVLREEIRKKLWPSDTVVEFDHSINAAVKRLRDALGDSAEAPRYIETVARRGYRFAGSVENDRPAQLETVAEQAAAAPAENPFVVIGNDLSLETKPATDFQPMAGPAPLQTAGDSSSVNPKPAKYRDRRWAAVTALVLGLAAGAAVAMRMWPTATQPAVTSLAVLPLTDLSPVSDGELNFADGMTDELIAQIGQIFGKRIRVTSRTTIMRYRQTPKTLADIARELNVDAVLEASVRRVNGTVEINATLKNALEERLWGNSYERAYEDILKLQREVARDIAMGINLELTPEDEDRLTAVERVDPEAHKNYLVGMQQLYEGKELGLLASDGYFKSAIDKDPNYASAYAGLGQSYLLQGHFGLRLSQEAYPDAKTAAMRALTLDSRNAEAHMVLARVRCEYERDYPGAEQEFQRALQLNPNLVVAYRWYSTFLIAMGRFDEVGVMSQQAEARDPQAMFLAANRGWAFYMARDYKASIAAYSKGLELAPDTQIVVEGLAESYAMAGRHQEAFEQYQRLASLGQMSPDDISALGRAFAARGIEGYWRKWLQIDAAEEATTGEIWPYHRALLHARLRDKEKALFWLEEAYKENHNRLMYLKVEPAFDSIRTDPRFNDLLRRLKLQ